MKTLIAMSGGVDSSVAAAIASASRSPSDCWGVHMLLNPEQEDCDLKSRSCCGTADAEDARKVAQQLGINFDAIPMYDSFRTAVINNFINEYAAGRTPVPCTHCNGVLKFNLLVDYADQVGYDLVATGHYVGQDESNRLWIAPDQKKDQSYFLWPIRQQVLNRLWFPLGQLDKQSTRDLALEWGLATATKRESMDICFVPKGNYRDVLLKERPDLFAPKTGEVYSTLTGQSLGNHEGYWNYTVGQRWRQPGMSEPLYVSRMVPEDNQIWVGSRASTLSSTIWFSDSNWHDPDFKCNSQELWIKTRAGMSLVRGHMNAPGCFIVDEPVNATPGQAIVFYSKHAQGFRLEGGGWIQCPL